jgi:histidinol-phosphate/aromatic aminotransferase/cobyric acid decarboxylase-like protein
MDFFREQKVRCHESAGNFVLFYPQDATSTETHLRERGVLIRDRSAQLPGALRITVGGVVTMNHVMNVMQDVFSQHEC